MPHVAVPFVGFRIRNEALRAAAPTLPGLRPRASALAELPALGLLTLAGLNPPDWSCSYHPAAADDDDLLQTVLSQRPDLVAVSALTASIDEAYLFCSRLAAEAIPTVIGGLHATAVPEEAIERNISVVVGAGEPVWPDVLTDAAAGSLKPAYRASDHLRPDGWAVPRFDLLGDVPRFTLQTQRGCPFACDFCAASRLLGRFQAKSGKQIRAEAGAIAEHHAAPLIELADDNTFAGDRDADAVLEPLAEIDARWFTESDWRIGERPELLKRMAQSGCVQILVGIESLVFRYPGMGTKQAELARVLRGVEAIQSAGIAVNACFIVGADGETRASMERLTRFLEQSEFADVQVTLQTPFPGTGLRRRLHAAGRLLPHRDWSAYTLFDVTHQPDQLSVAELERGFEHVLCRVYDRHQAQRRWGIRRQVWSRNPRLRSHSAEELLTHD